MIGYKGYKKVRETERIYIPGGYIEHAFTRKRKIEYEPRVSTPIILDNPGAVLKTLRKEEMRELGFKPVVSFHPFSCGYWV